MSKRKLVIYPDSMLRVKCSEVSTFSPDLEALVNDMLETMYAENGIGLAGPQIGVTSRIIVMDTSEKRDEPIHIINPEIIKAEGEVDSEEGCLSIPGYRASIQRSKKILVKGFDVQGKKLELEAEGLLSRCTQHEIDHLDGILFIDRLSRLKKGLFRHWFEKQAPLS